MWVCRRSNQTILKETSPEYSLEGPLLKLKLKCTGLLFTCHRVFSLAVAQEQALAAPSSFHANQPAERSCWPSTRSSPNRYIIWSLQHHLTVTGERAEKSTGDALCEGCSAQSQGQGQMVIEEDRTEEQRGLGFSDVKDLWLMVAWELCSWRQWLLYARCLSLELTSAWTNLCCGAVLGTGGVEQHPGPSPAWRL